jgi:MOSC domain-containing protein
MKTVARISVSPVKGFRLHHPAEVHLDTDGVPGNRRFFIVDADGQRLRGSQTPWFSLLAADYDEDSEQLTIRFPDGGVERGGAEGNGERIVSTSGTLQLEGTVVEGPWEAPLSEVAGKPVRLVRADRLDDVAVAPATLVSDGSLARLADVAGVKDLDARRFRMLFELAGCRAHEEDEWEGELLAIGDALVRVGTGVDRCAVTTRDPETAERDLDTLRLLADYRGRRERDGAVIFGVYATVERPGRVRVGDAVDLA